MEPVRQIAALLDRVRAALRGRTVAEPGLPYVSSRDFADPRSGQERIELFRENFEALGGTFLAGQPEEGVLQVLGERLRVEGVRALFCPEDDPAARAVADALVPFGPFLILPSADVLQADPPPSAGIQSAEFAVAETGTIVQTSRQGKSLLPGLASNVHVALLPSDRFLSTMEEALDGFCAEPPRNISLITGPSLTSDIEFTPATGVHGPRKVIAVLLS